MPGLLFSLTQSGTKCAKFNITGSSVKMADESIIVVNELSEDLEVENELFEEDDGLIVFSISAVS